MRHWLQTALNFTLSVIDLRPGPDRLVFVGSLAVAWSVVTLATTGGMPFLATMLVWVIALPGFLWLTLLAVRG